MKTVIFNLKIPPRYLQPPNYSHVASPAGKVKSVRRTCGGCPAQPRAAPTVPAAVPAPHTSPAQRPMDRLHTFAGDMSIPDHGSNSPPGCHPRLSPILLSVPHPSVCPVCLLSFPFSPSLSLLSLPPLFPSPGPTPGCCGQRPEQPHSTGGFGNPSLHPCTSLHPAPSSAWAAARPGPLLPTTIPCVLPSSVTATPTPNTPLQQCNPPSPCNALHGSRYQVTPPHTAACCAASGCNAISTQATCCITCGTTQSRSTTWGAMQPAHPTPARGTT